jgi:arsenate reductase
MTRHVELPRYDPVHLHRPPCRTAFEEEADGAPRGARRYHCDRTTSGSPELHRVLFICTGNSARSQMAEALLRVLGGSTFHAASAGTHPTAVHPLTLRVLGELGIDASGARSKHLDEFVDEPWDYAVTVCDQAAEACPVFPGASAMEHWSFPDPAMAHGPAEERTAAFRQARDAIRARVAAFVYRIEARPERL